MLPSYKASYEMWLLGKHCSRPDLNPGFAEVKPECQFLASEHIWILRLVERSLQLMQLIRRERRSTSTNFARLVVVDATVIHGALLVDHATVVVAVATVAVAIVVRLRDVSNATEVVVVAMSLLTVVVVVVRSLLVSVAVYRLCVRAATSVVPDIYLHNSNIPFRLTASHCTNALSLPASSPPIHSISRLYRRR